MKLSELAQDDFIKVLVYGDSGTGKTCLAASFPYPIEIWDFDGKANSAGYFYRNDKERLENIEVKSYNRFPKETKIAEWEKRSREVELLARDGKLPFKTLVIDSVTTFTDAILDDYMYRSQLGIKRARAGQPSMEDYGLLSRHIKQVTTGLMGLQCNVVFVGHVTTEKDENTGILRKTVMMPGKFAEKFPIYFEEVYVSKVDSKGQYLLQTQSDSYYTCRTQRGLAKEINASYEALKQGQKA